MKASRYVLVYAAKTRKIDVMIRVKLLTKLLSRRKDSISIVIKKIIQKRTQAMHFHLSISTV
jgi:hypothetical protein